MLYHASVPARCEGRPLHESDTVWSSPAWTTTDPRAVLSAWTTRFLGAFERTHPWPAEIQVAMRLRRRLREHPDLGTLAREAGTSRAALVRHFSQRYGVSIGAYQRRARVQEGLRLLQQTGACVESIARAVGYGSTKNFYAAIRRAPG